MKANVTLILLLVALLFLCSSRSSNAQVHFNEQPPARLDQPWKQLQQQQDGDVGLKMRTRTRRMQRRQAVTIDFSGPRSTTTTAAAAPSSSSSSSSSVASSSLSIISSPTSSSSSSSVSASPPPSLSTSSPSFSAPAPTAAPSPSTLNLSTTQQLFADLPDAVLLGANVEDLPGPASGVPALIPGLVALLIILGLWSTRKKLACPFTLILLSNVFLTIAALTLLISTTRGPSALAALLCSASTVTRFVWLALAAKFLFKASLAPPNQRSTSPRPEIFGFSSSSLPGSPDQVQRSRCAVVRIVVWVLILALGTFETAWRLAIVLSSHDLSMGLMCTANVLQALLLVVLVVAIASTARNGAHEARWRRRGASFAIGACCIGFAIAVTNMALHGFSEAPLGRLLLLVENLLFLIAATMLALPFESRDGLPRRLSLRRTGTAPPPYRNRSMSEKVKERRGPPPTVPQKNIEGASPRNATVRSPALKSIQRKSAPANLPIHPLILSGAAHQQTADTSLSAPTSPSLTTSPDVIQDRPELLRSNSSPNGCRTNVLLPPSTFDPTQYTVLRPNSTLTATSDERHAHSAIIVAAAPAPAPERDVARMVSLTRGRSKGGRSINSPDSSRTSLPPPVPAKLRRDTTRSSTFSAHSTVESSRGACGEDILDHFPTPPPSSRACGGVPASVRNSAALSELSERVELAYAQGEDEIYVLPEAPGLRRSSSRTHVSVTSFMSTLAARSGLSALRQTHTPSSSSMAPSSDAVHAPAPLPITASPVPASPKLTLEPTSDPADAATMHYRTSPPRTLLLLPEVTLANSDTSSMYVDDSGVWDVPVSPGLPRSRGGSNRSSLAGSGSGSGVGSGAAKVDSPSTSTKADLGHAQAHAHSASGQLLSPGRLTPTGWKRYSNTSIAASPLRRSFDTSAVSSEKEDQQEEEKPMQRSSLYMTPRNSIRTPPGWTKEADD